VGCEGEEKTHWKEKGGGVRKGMIGPGFSINKAEENGFHQPRVTWRVQRNLGGISQRFCERTKSIRLREEGRLSGGERSRYSNIKEPAPSERKPRSYVEGGKTYIKERKSGRGWSREFMRISLTRSREKTRANRVQGKEGGKGRFQRKRGLFQRAGGGGALLVL